MRAPKRRVRSHKNRGLKDYESGRWWEGPDREWLMHHYSTLKKSARRIAKEIGASSAVISRWMRSMGVAHRTAAQRAGELGSNWRGGRSRTTARKLGSKLPLRCDICGNEEEQFHIHHKDGNHRNNHIENLQRLCPLCHRGVHHGF